jgi:hypothetical protein
METKKILILLNEIETITKFQKEQVNRNAVNCDLFLNQSMDFIENYAEQIKVLI